MNRPVFIASRNQHKIAEISAIFSNIGLAISPIGNLDNIPDAVEDGNSFYENALKKAEHYYHYIKEPLIADDSGLVVPALNGMPGLYSSRYAGKHGDYRANNEKLLREMKDLTGDQRRAYFICVVVYKDANLILNAEGRLHGSIITAPRGTYGFGYDPLFKPDSGQFTLAELSDSAKNRISHRFLAFSKIAEIITKQA